MKKLSKLLITALFLFSHIASGGSIFSRPPAKKLKYFKGYDIHINNLEDAESFADFLVDHDIAYALNLGWRPEASMEISDEYEALDFYFCIGISEDSIEYTFDDLKELREIIEQWAKANYEGTTGRSNIEFMHTSLDESRCFHLHFFALYGYNLKDLVMCKSSMGSNHLLFAMNNVDDLEPIFFDRTRLPQDIYTLLK